MSQDHYLGQLVPDDCRREWEVYKYLQPFRNLRGTPGYSSPRSNTAGPFSSHDRALTAFAQLGALRLNARRALISLIDRYSQHIVAEGTRTLSLQDDQVHDDPEDDLWLGATTIPRGTTPCAYAAGLLIPPEIESRFSDTGKGDHDFVAFPDIKKHPQFRDQVFVTGKPKGRFYAGVPIISPDGFNVGVYCVLDDKPRDGITLAEIAFLKDMAATVMSHLVMVRAKDELRRSQKMVQGLSNFQHRQPSQEQPVDTSPSPVAKFRKGHKRIASGDRKQQPERHISSDVRSTFQRAAEIVRDVTDLDGAVLLDASIARYAKTDIPRERNMSTSSSATDLSGPTDDPNFSSGEQDHGKSCTVLGKSLLKRCQNPSLPDVSAPLPVCEDFLQSLLRKYPSGKIWTYDPVVDKIFEQPGDEHCNASGISDLARKEWSERRILRKMFPGFRSLALVGMRNSASSRWFAATIAWTCSPTRVLTPDGELDYLIAFSQSVMSELARLDVKVADQAKTAFISSISHELRTPLHGIMGSLECLQNTSMDSFQSDLLNTIDTCNQTLLDIFDNLLSFTSIDKLMKDNNWNNADPTSSNTKRLSKSAATPDSNVDLRAVVESVIETILAGRRFTGKHDTGTDAHRSRDAVNLLLDIEDKADLYFHTQPGGWRRLILNLVTNGLKYTDAGLVSVRLSSRPLPNFGSQRRSQVTLTVTDTGRGMSPEFLRLQLFSPFVQEDPLAPGTGLGLSICKEIVTSLGGEISVTSEKGKGSEFQISVSLAHSPPLPEQPLVHPAPKLVTAKPTTDHLRIRGLGLSDASQLGKGTLDSLFARQCVSWLDMTTSASWENHDEDLYIVSEYQASTLATRLQKPLIVVRNMYSPSDPSLSRHLTTIAPHVEYLEQPWTPVKLANAIKACMDEYPTRSGVELDIPPTQTPSELKTENMPIQEKHQRGVDAELTPPASLPDTSIKAAPTPQPTQSVEHRKPPTISVLLVDDNPINVQLLATFMKKQKYHHDIAVNGLEAVKSYQSFNLQQVDGAAKLSYDYILMDINMPVMDGLEASRRIRDYECSAGLKPCSIIMLTGAGSLEIQQDAFASGADMFLTKPVRLKQLGKMLQDLASR